MTLPSGKSRRIRVADTEFRWLKSSGDSQLDLRVELFAEPASQLVAHLKATGAGALPQVGPGLVAAIIEAALQRGWAPEQHQPGQFILEGVDELVEAHDLRLRKDLTCLIIAPFDAGAARLRRTLALAVRELGVQVREAVQAPAPVADTIATWIADADVVLADITRRNPNVLYQVGYAHALGKSTVLLVDDDAATGVPASLSGHLVVPYSEQDLGALKERVRRAVLRSIRGRIPR